MANLETQVKSLAEEVQSAIAKLKKTGQEKSRNYFSSAGRRGICQKKLPHFG